MIVVLDEDEALREALRFSLETEGYRVSAFGAASELLDSDQCSGAACFVIDEDGCEPGLTQQLRRRRVPVILLSSGGRRPQRTRLGGLISVVEKPLITDALSRQIAAVVQ